MGRNAMRFGPIVKRERKLRSGICEQIVRPKSCARGCADAVRANRSSRGAPSETAMRSGFTLEISSKS